MLHARVPGGAAGNSFRPARRPSFRRPQSRTVESLEPRTLLATFTVTTTADAGPGSLRQAMLDANGAAGADDIRFNIPGPGVHTIAPLSPLPPLVATTRVLGNSQPGYATAPLIELDGSGAGDFDTPGLLVRGSGSEIVALAINQFSGHGVVLQGSTTLRRNHIGTDPSGTAARGNGGAGVMAAAQAQIGTTAAGDGNVISANGFAGVWVNAPGTPAAGVTIVGNFIGTDLTGAAPLGNGREGVLIEAAAGARVGLSGPGAPSVGNVISGNGASGVRVGRGGNGTGIAGNLIGTDATGTRAIPNGASPLTPYRDGVTVLGPQACSVGFDNVISGNAGHGVFWTGGGRPQILRNRIGTDRAGNGALPNGGDGIHAVSATGLQIQSNVVSGNAGDGVFIDAGGGEAATYTLYGNFVGTNAAGAAPLGNGGDGVDVIGRTGLTLGGPAAQNRNVISANRGAGVRLDTGGYSVDLNFNTAVAVTGNYIGTDAAGNADLGNGAWGVTASGPVGGTVRITGNLVSGNDGGGVQLVGVPGATVAGNYVGTNAAGSAAVGNGGSGVELRSCESGVAVGGPNLTAVAPPVIDPAGEGRNVISGNRGHGVLITGPVRTGGLQSGSRVFGNLIGTDAPGNAPLGNGGSGVFIDSGAHTVGGFTSGQGNLISANGADGVTISGLVHHASPTGPLSSARDNLIAGNRIGTNAARSDAVSTLGNRGNGVGIYHSSGNRVGDPEIGTNTIAFNGRAGVYVEGVSGVSIPPATADDGNRISGNFIFSNGGLGIDLAPAGLPGVTPNDANDADHGPNNLTNFPELGRATGREGETAVEVRLRGAPNTFHRVEVFASPQQDPSGFGEGKRFLGFVNLLTNTTGTASTVARFNVTTAPGEYITATASTPTGDTSEFSLAARVQPTETPARVLGRYVFYDNSAFDDDAWGGPGEAAAIATDKQALLPGQKPSFQNITSYNQGINGVIIDLIGRPLGVDAPLDIRIRSRDGAEGSAWRDGPRHQVAFIAAGGGEGGSDRIHLYFHEGTSGEAAAAVRNGWLEVTLKAGPTTGLAIDDVFYFGNLVGETGVGTPASTFFVSPTDWAATRTALGTTDAPAINRFDHNRDGRVSVLDLAVVRSNLSRRLTSPFTTAPPPAPAPAAAPTSLWEELNAAAE